SPSNWFRIPSRRPLILIASSVIAIGLVFGLWWFVLYKPDLQRGLIALSNAYRRERPVEERITGFGYAPWPDRRGEDPPDIDTVSLDLAERLLLDAVRRHPDSRSRSALGALYLAERKFDKARAQFEEALSKDPNSAAVHSNYGAALLELAKT